eukprot:jgi/Mesvir1/11598/Mv00009-RA.1
MTAVAILAYGTASSVMLVLNKLAVDITKEPNILLCIQLATTAMFVKALQYGDYVEVDAITWDKFKKFYLVMVSFVGAVYSSIKVLESANVETFIVFRCTSPLVVALLDSIFLGRELPSKRSWLCLVFVLLGAVTYVKFDADFVINAYVWVAIYMFFIIFECVWTKHVINTVEMTSWGRVYYCNFFSSIPVGLLGLYMYYKGGAAPMQLSIGGIAALTASCVAGMVLSYTGFLLRKLVAASTFATVGVLCKVFTVIINTCMWEKHANLGGTLALFVTLFAGFFYREPPMKNAPPPKEIKDKEEAKELLPTRK